jgi:hypothetical protein
VVDHAPVVDGILMFERDVHMIAADELYAKHDGCHANQRIPAAGRHRAAGSTE